MERTTVTHGVSRHGGLQAISAELDVPLRELVEQLGDLQDALRQLVDVASAKLSALRRADTAGLQECAHQEGELLKRLFTGERQRHAVLAQVAQVLHIESTGPPPLREVAARLPEPLASALRAKSEGLQQLALELQRKNRLTADVAQNLQTHIRGIFADLANAARETMGYGPEGKREQSATRNWVNAVG